MPYSSKYSYLISSKCLSRYIVGEISDLFFQNDPIGSERQGKTDAMRQWVRVEQQHILTRRLHNDSVTTIRIKVPFSSFIRGWGLIGRVGVGLSEVGRVRVESERDITVAGDRRASTEHNHAYLYYTQVTMTSPVKQCTLYSISVTIFCISKNGSLCLNPSLCKCMSAVIDR